MLIAETYTSYVSTPKYTICDTKHPDGKAYGGVAIIILNVTKYTL